MPHYKVATILFILTFGVACTQQSDKPKAAQEEWGNDAELIFQKAEVLKHIKAEMIAEHQATLNLLNEENTAKPKIVAIKTNKGTSPQRE